MKALEFLHILNRGERSINYPKLHIGVQIGKLGICQRQLTSEGWSCGLMSERQKGPRTMQKKRRIFIYSPTLIRKQSNEGSALKKEEPFYEEHNIDRGRDQICYLLVGSQ